MLCSREGNYITFPTQVAMVKVSAYTFEWWMTTAFVWYVSSLQLTGGSIGESVNKLMETILVTPESVKRILSFEQFVHESHITNNHCLILEITRFIQIWRSSWIAVMSNMIRCFFLWNRAWLSSAYCKHIYFQWWILARSWIKLYRCPSLWLWLSSSLTWWCVALVCPSESLAPFTQEKTHKSCSSSSPILHQWWFTQSEASVP